MSEQIVLRSDVATFEFVWIEALIDPWQPEYLFQAGQVVRPSLSNGYLAVCTRGGLSGFREPIWPAEDGAQVDGRIAGVAVGTCEWSMKRPENVAALPTIDAMSFTLDPGGLVTVLTQIIQASRTTRISIDGSAADAGEYTITAEITDGLTRDHVKRMSFILSD